MSTDLTKRVSCPGCATGISWCERRPCWPTPAEAKAIEAAGLGHRLMRDYWIEVDGPDLEIRSPAVVGYEGRAAPFFPLGRCTFLTEQKECELVPLGLQPTEGAVACCKLDDQDDVHRLIADLWRGGAT